MGCSLIHKCASAVHDSLCKAPDPLHGWPSSCVQQCAAFLYQPESSSSSSNNSSRRLLQSGLIKAVNASIELFNFPYTSWNQIEGGVLQLALVAYITQPALTLADVNVTRAYAGPIISRSQGRRLLVNGVGFGDAGHVHIRCVSVLDCRQDSIQPVTLQNGIQSMAAEACSCIA